MKTKRILPIVVAIITLLNINNLKAKSNVEDFFLNTGMTPIQIENMNQDNANNIYSDLTKISKNGRDFSYMDKIETTELKNSRVKRDTSWEAKSIKFGVSAFYYKKHPKTHYIYPYFSGAIPGSIDTSPYNFRKDMFAFALDSKKYQLYGVSFTGNMFVSNQKTYQANAYEVKNNGAAFRLSGEKNGTIKIVATALTNDKSGVIKYSYALGKDALTLITVNIGYLSVSFNPNTISGKYENLGHFKVSKK